MRFASTVLAFALAVSPVVSAQSPAPADRIVNDPSFKAATDAYQREFILHKLAQHDGNVSKAAEEMGVDRSHLYRRMRSLGIKGQ